MAATFDLPMLSAGISHGNKCDFAFAKFLSTIPRFFKPGTFLLKEDEEKYLRVFAGCEYWLDTRIHGETEVNQKIRGVEPIINMINNETLRTIFYTGGIRSIFRKIFAVISYILIKKKENTERIAAIDKYMFNLLAAGEENVIAVVGKDVFNFSNLKMTMGGTYYYKSLNDPEFDIVKFLVNGPQNMLFSGSLGLVLFEKIIWECIDPSTCLEIRKHYFTRFEFDMFLMIHNIPKKLWHNKQQELIDDLFPNSGTLFDYWTIPY